MTANWRKPCSNYTLPSLTKFDDIPVCNDTGLASCKSNALISLHRSEEVCKQNNDKLGVIKEFKIGQKNTFSHLKNYFAFRILMYGPDSPKGGLRISHLYKEVSTETPTISTYQIIGTIGGTLGMMVGFSFFTCIEWIAPRLTPLLAKMCKGKVSQKARISTLTKN